MSKLVLRGEVRRAYTINVEPEPLYDYLSDMHNLLTRVPNATKIQLRKNSGRGRVFMNMGVMGASLNFVMDVEPTLDRESKIIKLATPETPLDVIPAGFMTGIFSAHILIAPKENGDTKISSKIGMAFDAMQVVANSIFSRDFVETAGPRMMQDYIDRLSLEYMNKLAGDFPAWYKEYKKNKSLAG